MAVSLKVASALAVVWGPLHAMANAPVVNLGYRYPDPSHVSYDIQTDHIWYNMPGSTDMFNNGVYASTKFTFQSHTPAYMGSQVTRDTFSGEYTQFVFSVWDLNSYMKPQGIGSGCERFGNEGNGAKCILKKAITPYVKYTVQVRLTSTTSAGQTWTGTVSVGGQTSVIGSMFLPNAMGMQGWGPISGTGVTGFYENWENTFPCSMTPHSKVGMVGPYLSDRSVRPVFAAPLYTVCDNSDCVGSIPGQPAGGPNILCEGGSNVVRRHRSIDWQHLGTVGNAGLSNESLGNDSLVLV